MLLKVKAFKQLPSFCGPACLQKIFHYYGVEASQKEIAKVAGTTLSVGTGKRGIFKAAKFFGFKAQQFNDVKLSQLRKWNQKGIPVMLDYYKVDARPDTHYSVLLDITKNKVTYLDPEDAKIHRVTTTYFERVWFGFKDTKLHRKNFYHRRAYVITPQ